MVAAGAVDARPATVHIKNIAAIPATTARMKEIRADAVYRATAISSLNSNRVALRISLVKLARCNPLSNRSLAASAVDVTPTISTASVKRLYLRCQSFVTGMRRALSSRLR